MITQPVQAPVYSQSLSAGTVVQSLNGAWQLAADPQDQGLKSAWFNAAPADTVACPVPGIMQQALPNYHGVAWYYFNFEAAANPHPHGRFLLRFGAVDNESTVWVNGQSVGGFENPETPFTLDVTAAVKTRGKNLIAVRVYNPVGDDRTQRPNRNKTDSVECVPGSAFNYGGVLGNVELLVVPAVYVEDLFVTADLQSGLLTIEATVQNTQPLSITGTLDLEIGPAAQGDTRQTVQLERELAPGRTTVKSTVTVAQPRAWSLDDPFLYRVTARVSAATPVAAVHSHSVRCGFRDFRVVDGFFHLNGKRVFLRSTHTGNHLPFGQVTPPNHEFLRRDMIYAKASGFNMVRFISGVAWPEQLDFCDELGLMVYEESMAGWCLKDSPKMKERFDRSVREMVRRDRNHPSVTIWGMLNETPAGAVFDAAVAALAVMRAEDPSRLVLLSSGRWDGKANIGSVANPGSKVWQHEWGIEAPGVEPLPANLVWSDFETKFAGGYAQEAGDAHMYPRVPQAPFATRAVRTAGANTKPVFLSEYGIGSLENAIHELRNYEQAGAREDLKDVQLVRSIAERYIADWKRFGMEEVYAFPEDMLLESQRLHARQRLFTFDCLRSNPKYCGYNLTGMLDHAFTGEGLWTLWRRWKVGTFDAISDGWAPLRWCLFVEPMHAYAGRPFKVEAVLANEDVLQPGEYPVHLRIFGPEGPVWERRVTVTIPRPSGNGSGSGKLGALAIPVLAEEITLNTPPGKYQFAANIERGAAPAGGRLTFHLSDAAALPRLSETVATWGIEARHANWLNAHGVATRPFNPAAQAQPEIVLVGNHFTAKPEAADWRALAKHIARGNTAVYLVPQALVNGDQSSAWLPLEEKGRCDDFNDWLYHKECVAKRHAVFAGLDGPGVMDWEYYEQAIARNTFSGQKTPDEVYAAAFGPGHCGNHRNVNGYGAGVLLGNYRLGSGRFIVNTFRILETLDANPAADRLLLNVIQEARRITAPRVSEPNAETEQLLNKLYV